MTLTHDFRAARTDDGFTVFDVPIFAACSRGEHTFDADWIDAAVDKAKRRASEGYHPPLHIRHHEPKTSHDHDAVRAAGYFRVTRAGFITLGGERVRAMFADLVFTNEVAAMQAVDMQLPYRSVEIFHVDEEPSIDGLALLDHEAPFLELPLLKIGRVADDRTLESVSGETNRTTVPEGVVAFAVDGSAATLTFAGTDMTTTEDATTIDETQATDAQATDEPTTFADDADNPVDTDADADAETMDDGLNVEAICAAIESGAIPVAAQNQLMAALQAAGAGGPNPAQAQQPAQAPAPVSPAPPSNGPPQPPQQAQIMSDTPTDAANFAAMQGRIDGLEAREAQRAADDKRRTEVDAAMTRIGHLPLGANLRDKLEAFHKEHDGAGFDAYVDAFAQTAPAPADADDPRVTAFAAQGGNLPEVAMSYNAQGTDAVHQAATLSRQYDELREAGGIRASREAYVRTNMRKRGFEDPQPAS